MQVMDDLKAMVARRHRIQLCACLCPCGELTNRTGHHPCVQELCRQTPTATGPRTRASKILHCRPGAYLSTKTHSLPTQQLVSQHAFDPRPCLIKSSY